MKIGIVGTGNMASGIVSRLASLGHTVTIGSREFSRAEASAAPYGDQIHPSGIEAIGQGNDLLILAIHFGALEAVAAQIGHDYSGTILQMINPVTEDFMGLTVGHTTSAAEEVQRAFPRAEVVTGFNTLFAQVLQLPTEQTAEVPVLLASDSDSAKQTCAGLVGEMGFQVMDCGGLSNSRYIEPLAELNIHLGYALGWGTEIAPRWLSLG